ncbi:Poly [ADP-ribose] polymerase 14, partial [Stylophora pistillata]
FRKIKTKCEERGLDGAQVSIEQVPVCKSILVTGFSENVTHDFIELYFESRRNGGGPVEKVHYRPKSGRAVVVFQDAKDMENVITRHEEKPHILQQTQVSIKLYQEFLVGEEVDLADGTGDLGASATGASEARVSKKPDAKTQQLHIAVDPDVMEYVNSTGFQAELNNSLAEKKSAITWKPNNKMAVIVYRGEEDSESWQSECIDQVQSYLGKFAKCDVQVNKDFWEAVVANLPSVRACLGVDPPLVKTIPDSNVARIVSLETDVKSNEEKTLRAIVQKCLQTGETLGANSIAFPVIGTGNLHFPRDTASRIMLEETINFCQTNPASNLRDIRFVVFNQDQALTAAFKQEMDKLQPKHIGHSAITTFATGIRSFFGGKKAVGTSGVSIEVLQGNLCQEKTDAIVNITSKDLNMDSAGKLSKEVKRRGGQQIQDELNQFGQQSGGIVLITSGGNLHAPNILHLIPDTNNKDHLQQCVEKCLQLAESHGLKSISIPAVGTGAFHVSARDSASLIFKALTNFSGSFRSVCKVRIVIFEPPMVSAFQQEYQRHSFSPQVGMAQRMTFTSPFTVEVINDDLTKENSTDAIMNIISTDMKMTNAGQLGAAVANASGTQVQQECDQLGKQSPGTAVMTSGGNLHVPYIIHIIPGSSDKQHLQQCLEEGLRVADAHGLQSISIPCVGTDGYGLTGADSAQLTFKALNIFSARCKNIQRVRVIVFQASMMQEFLQEPKKQLVQDIEEKDSDTENVAAWPTGRIGRRQAPAQDYEHSVIISLIGKDEFSVGKAEESLKKGFYDACTMEKVESEVVSQLSDKQKDILRKKAKGRDVRLEIEDDVDRIVVRGEPTEVSGMVGEIWKEINERTKNKQEEEQAKLVSKNVEWSYELHGTKMAFAPKANAKIELAYSKDEHNVQVPLRGDKFVIDLKRNSGCGQTSGEQITLTRKVKGADEAVGIALPKHWAPMPGHDSTVHKVQLLPGSHEYQDVLRQFQATVGGVNVHKIERVQNPHLYQSYMVRKQKMDKDTGGSSERQLFHGTDAKNISHINAQGFNRSFCGAH